MRVRAVTNWDAFFCLHRDIPREGPGSDSATLEAIRRLPPLAESPRVLDLGCGPGRQTLVLARELKAPIFAVDTHEPYLARLRRSAAEAGLADLVQPRLGRMESLDEPPGTVDLIWAEGSIFVVGFAAGLRLWRPLLSAGGLVVASELTWLADDPPADVLAFFRAEYPAMTTTAGNIRAASDAGFEVFDLFVLPRAAWWDDYLTPLAARMAELRSEAQGDPALTEVLDGTAREIDICARYGDAFGYVFYLMRNRRS